MAGQNAAPLLKVEGLKQYFRVSKSYTVKAVDNVSFEIYPAAASSACMTPLPARSLLMGMISAAG